MIRLVVTFTIFLLATFSLYGQHTIKGKVIDTNKIEVSNANVVLYQDGKLITGEVTDIDGKYQFNDLVSGIYMMEVSVLGFKTVKSEKVNLSDKNKIKIIDFTLQETAESLNEVVLKIKRPTIKQTAEKLVVNFEKSNLVSVNLQDVMKRIPGVIVTNNGISYAGQKDIRILINGKTTDYMDMDTLLRDFPADNIAKIELIEQPGAEFDATGSGPIINIILKKNVKLGNNGSIKAWVGEDEGVEYGTSASFASYKNKLNWQIGVGYSAPTWREDLFITRKVGALNTYKQATISPYNPITKNASASMDYYINDKNIIGLNTRVQKTKSDRISSDETTLTTNSTFDFLNTENSFKRDRNVFNINPYYEFESDKNKLVLDYNYATYKNNNINNLYNVGVNTIPFTNTRYFQDGKYTINTYKLDYKYTFSENLSLRLGSKLAQVNTDNDLKSYELNLGGTFDFLPSESNRFLIDESIYAFYSKINYTKNEWSFSGGLRFEDSNTKGTSTNTNETKTRKISKFFPSASMSRKFTEEIGAALSYSYRIQRPSYNSLNSFVYHLNPTAIESGNPNLKPSFTNNFQFNLTYNNQPFFTVGYKTTKDALLEVITQDDTTGQIVRAMDNIKDRENWNFRIFGPLSFVKKLEGYTGFIVNYNKYNIENVKSSKWSIMWYTSASYQLPWNINAETSGYYSTGPLEGQLDMDWLASLDFSLSKTFYKNKFKVNLGIRKILNRDYEGVIKYKNIDADFISAESKQNVYLQLAYNFGSKFNKKKKKENTSQEEERIQDNN